MENIFLGFLKAHMIFGWKISLFLFLMSGLFSINMANDCSIDTQMCSAISPNQRQSTILHFFATGKSFSDLKFLNAISERAWGHIVMETCGEINIILKYNIKAN